MTKKNFFKFIRDNNELWSIPLAGFLYIKSPDAIRLLDPTAGAFDAGYLHKITLALVFVLAFFGLSWLWVFFNFPSINRYLNHEFKNDFAKLAPWQKIKLSFFVLFFLLACFMVASRV